MKNHDSKPGDGGGPLDAILMKHAVELEGQRQTVKRIEAALGPGWGFNWDAKYPGEGFQEIVDLYDAFVAMRAETGAAVTFAEYVGKVAPHRLFIVADGGGESTPAHAGAAPEGARRPAGAGRHNWTAPRVEYERALREAKNQNRLPSPTRYAQRWAKSHRLTKDAVSLLSDALRKARDDYRKVVNAESDS